MADKAAPESEKTTIARLTLQLKKLNEANGKYKNLLKLAKERIQQQQTELDDLQAKGCRPSSANDENEEEKEVVAVCQRVKFQDSIWALLEYEVIPPESDALIGSIDTRRFLQWSQFDTESALQDFIRRDTGEPLTLPPYSLSPEQSATIQHQAQVDVAAVTEEFRRFRVRSELARKQTDAQLRELQSQQVQKAAQRIESNNGTNNGGLVLSETEREASLQAELQLQETRWQQAYDVLLAENNALKSSGSEALLASQWRQRYETCRAELEDLEGRLKALKDVDQYESKYRDLKESFKMYRKKAKEIFEEQQQPDGVMISNQSSADAKLSYLKNLMVNYFTSDISMRQPMEGAIGMVLQFSPEEMQRIEKKREEAESWFY